MHSKYASRHDGSLSRRQEEAQTAYPGWNRSRVGIPTLSPTSPASIGRNIPFYSLFHPLILLPSSPSLPPFSSLPLSVPPSSPSLAPPPPFLLPNRSPPSRPTILSLPLSLPLSLHPLPPTPLLPPCHDLATDGFEGLLKSNKRELTASALEGFRNQGENRAALHRTALHHTVCR